MKILSLFALALAGCILISIIKRLLPNLAISVSEVVAILIVGCGLALLSPAISFLKGISDKSEYVGSLKIMLKALGISIAASFAGELCRDFGEESIARAVDFVAKCELIIISLPLWKSLLSIAISLISK